MAVVGLAALGGLLMRSGARAKSSPKVDAEFKKMDRNHDGRISAGHVAGSKAMFDRMDSDRDGFVSDGELAAGHARLMPKSGH
jgi:Ca2+-binding EF-hand superfamily protein